MKSASIKTVIKSTAVCLAAALVVMAGQIMPTRAAAGKTVSWSGAGPKYVFMFIGDGMSFPQMSITSAYLGALEGKVESVDLSMSNFPVVGSATTFDSTSFAPDSASTATSLSTGHKTLSGVINMDETKTTSFETITEKVKEQLGWKVGIISTVNLNHATPAAYYGHQASRNNYDDLTTELVNSGFDYFAGGKLIGETPADTTYGQLEAKGFTVVTTNAEYNALKGTEEKLAIFSDDKDFSDDTGAMHYDLDRPDTQATLADYVATGIETLDNEKGFFMMVEGGKIDWASHANDAASALNDVLALSDAVQEAIDFYNNHPEETLILVTGDHETGGLSIGFAGTGYDTHLDMLTKQRMSFVEYDKHVTEFRESGASFETVMESITDNFGLMAAGNADAEEDSLYVLSDYELSQIENAYEKSMEPKDGRTFNEQENLLYGGYEPLTVTLTHILNQKSGIGWTSYAHTGLPVPVYAMGTGEDLFVGYYDNTDVFHNLQALTKVK